MAVDEVEGVQIGVTFPTTEIGSDPDDISRFAKAVDERGFTHLLAFDHVVGVDTTDRPGWKGPFSVADAFHEPLTLFAFVAAITALELFSGVLVLPQRPTVLVAKQAAEVALLSGGRLRLGVGIGWNEVEARSLGSDFATRGARLEAQIRLLRELWRDDSVTTLDRFHTLDGVGISPKPRDRLIPVWIGGGAGSDAALRRVGRIADGWYPNLMKPMTSLEDFPGEDRLRRMRDVVDAAALAAHRDPTTIGLQGTVNVGAHVTASALRRDLARWKSVGATHVAIGTLGCGRAANDHVATVHAIADSLEL